MDLKKIAVKWQRAWQKDRVFQTYDFSKKKYFLTTPYPYMSGILHLGHLYTYIAPEACARYKRMKGYNVLFKFGFHCTGTPILAAAKRVEQGEKTQLMALKKMGVSDTEKFADPYHWVKYFPKETLKDMQKMGMSIDKDYTFITTHLNPSYDKFIRWQFNKLKEKGLVKQGKHPVVWDPIENVPVGDHDRSEGEGETPQEFTILKFKIEGDDKVLLAATLRPETVYGQTNLWVNPKTKYDIVMIDKQKCIVSLECTQKLKYQDHEIERVGRIEGKELIGKKCMAPKIERGILILPSDFCDPEIGTGIVTSVPSHAPFDWIALEDIKKDVKQLKKYGVEERDVKKIEPVSLIEIPGYSEHPAKDVCEKMGIRSQKDAQKLEAAKKEIYKAEHFQGIMKIGEYKGRKVLDAKDRIKKELIDEGKAQTFYELTGEVISRNLNKCVVKVVENQWFIEYNNEKWKAEAHKSLSKINLNPQIVRKQFEYVIDWLNRWACSREFGLGTKLPWDEQWVIESLSDSTLQMAYATVSKYLENLSDYGMKIEEIDDKFFDYVFLGKGKCKTKAAEKLRSEFEYWYPFDFRNSAKDLLQNHLVFSLFNHTAVFDKSKWPQAYILNGRVMINNEKMSKSKGNFYTVRELYSKFSPDSLRLAAAYAGEGVEDANFDMAFLDSVEKKLPEMHVFCKEWYGKGREKMRKVDQWMQNVVEKCVKECSEALENMHFKSAVKVVFMDMPRHFKWYHRRTQGDYHNKTVQKYIEYYTKMLSPFAPHFCEEVWESIGKARYVSTAKWPDSKYKNESFGEELIEKVLEDSTKVIKLSRLKPKRVTLITAAQWKHEVIKIVAKERSKDFKHVLEKLNKYSKHKAEIVKFLPKILKTQAFEGARSQMFENEALTQAKEFFERELGCKIEVAQESSISDPKSKKAMPQKPAIIVE